MIKGDSEIIPRAVHRSPCIYRKAEQTPGKPQLGDRRWMLCNQSSPQMGSITSNCNRWGRTDRWRGSFIHGAMSCGQKSFKLAWLCHQLLSRILAKCHLSRMSHQSCLSANDKDDNEMIPGAVTDNLAFTFQHRKPHQYWACCPWSHRLQRKTFKPVWGYQQLQSGVLSKGHLSRVSRQSRL